MHVYLYTSFWFIRRVRLFQRLVDCLMAFVHVCKFMFILVYLLVVNVRAYVLQ